MTFEGIHTPVITPHREDGSIDRDAFAAQVEHLVAAGVHGIINGGSTGEYYAQSMAERLEMASLARDLTRGRVPLMVWCMERTASASRSAVAVEPYAVPMKNATEWPSRAPKPAGSISGMGLFFVSGLTRREWWTPIQ